MTSPWSPSTFGPPAATPPPMIGTLLDFNQAETGSGIKPSRPESSIFAGIEAFSQAMRETRLDPGEIIPDGTLHRFDVPGDRPKSRNGWYVFYADGIQAGRFGSWKTGENIPWCSGNQSEFSAEEKAAYRAKMEAARRVRDAGQQRVSEECREWCKTTWTTAKAATDDHPYLVKKQVSSHGLKQFNDALIVPVSSLDRTIHGIQFINPDGSKKFKTGTVKQGHFHLIGKPVDNTMIVCEGYATGASIHQATGHAVLVAFDAGNLKPVAESIHKQRPQLKLIIAADDDHATEGNPGLTKATAAAQAVNGVLVVPDFPDVREPNVTDFNDLASREGLEAVRQQIEAATMAKPQRKPALFESAADFLTEKTVIKYLIHHVFELFSLVSITGPSGQYKSFVAVCIACCVAFGKPWNGHEVKKGAVLYLAGEGRNGIKRRVMAWLITNNLFPSDLAGFYLSKNTLMMDGSNVDEIVSEMNGIDVVLVIVDTLARHISGHENDTQDMVQFVNHVDRLKDRLGATAIVVHHTGHDQTRGRGNTAYKAALDVEIMCDQGVLTFTKMKDAEPPEPMEFKLAPVVIGNDDETQEPITSAVVEYGERSKQSKTSGFTRMERLAIESLVKLSASDQADEVNGKRGGRIGDWRQKFFDFRLNSDPDIKKPALLKAFTRASESLIFKGIVEENGHTRILTSDDHQKTIQMEVTTQNIMVNIQSGQET